MASRTFEFGKIATYKGEKKVHLVTVSMELKSNKHGFPVFTASGAVWNARHTDHVWSGQILGELKSVPMNNALYQEIRKMWSKYHMNDFNAGTKAQEAALKKVGLTGASKYSEACAYLKKIGLYEVNLTPAEARYNPDYAGKPYRYGHGWLYRPIPAADLAKIKAMISGNYVAAQTKKVPAPFGL